MSGKLITLLLINFPLHVFLENGNTEDKISNEQESTTQEKSTVDNKMNATPPTTNSKKGCGGNYSTTDLKKNAASRSSTFTGLSVVGFLVGFAFLWA
jgi:hypothetical protein